MTICCMWGFDWETFILGDNNVQSSSWNYKFVGQTGRNNIFLFDLVAVSTPFIKIATTAKNGANILLQPKLFNIYH